MAQKKNTTVTHKRTGTTPKRAARPRVRRIGKKTHREQQIVYGHDLPRWKFRLILLVLTLLVAAVFYFFFVRPYAYRWAHHEGLKQYDVYLPVDYDIHGMDISHHQGEINWDTLVLNQSKDYPIQFAFIKATEGGNLQDDRFASNFENAEHHGILRGAYHFFIPKTDPVAQARNFITTVHLQPGDLPPVLDIESTSGCKKKELKRNVKRWLDLVEDHYGVKPILYTSYKFREKYLSDSIFNEYPYWIAHYYVDSVSYNGPWVFWQHTDIARIPGIKQRVDMNVFHGTIDDLYKLTIK